MQIAHNGGVFYQSCTFSETHIYGPMQFDGNRLEQPLPNCRQSSFEHVTRRLKVTGSDPLEAVFADIATFSKSIGHAKTGRQAKKLAAQLIVILNTLQKAEHGTPSDIVDHQIRHLRRRLKQTTHVKINEAHLRREDVRRSEVHSELYNVKLNGWNVCLMTRTFKARYTDGSFDAQTCCSLHVQSCGTSEVSQVSAYFNERTNWDHTVWLHPTILAYNVVESNASVFDLVRRDDLNGLKEMLQRGQASLRDCDNRGRSLLLVSSVRNRRGHR
jgi:hypothetical protein